MLLHFILTLLYIALFKDGIRTLLLFRLRSLPFGILLRNSNMLLRSAIIMLSLLLQQLLEATVAV